MSKSVKFMAWTTLYLVTTVGCAYLLGLGYGAGCTAILKDDETTPEEKKEEDPEEEE